MPSSPTAALAVLAMGALIASAGCGGSSKPSSQSASSTKPATSGQSSAVQPPTPSGPLTSAQLIEKGDAICYRLNARRQSTSISRPQDYVRLVPALAAYELKGAGELAALTPPASMAGVWRRIVDDSRTIAAVTGRFHTIGESERLKVARQYDVILSKAVNDVTRVAKKAGFKECSRFL